MPEIRSKKGPVIQKGTSYTYDPNDFTVPDNFYITDSASHALSLLKPFELFGRKFLVFDTETHPYYKTSTVVPEGVVRRWVGKGKQAVPQDYPFCISICDGTNCVTLFDSVENNFDEMRKLSVLMEDESIEKVAQNTKFDMHMIANAKCKIKGRLHDTVVMAKLANENRKSFTLVDMATLLPDSIVRYEYMVDSYKKANKVTDYRHIPRQLLGAYANADVWNAYIVLKKEYSKVIEDDLEKLYDNECELMVALYEMERRGMKTDYEYEEDLKSTLQKLADTAELTIYDAAGYQFNINSTAQLYKVLMELGVDSSLISRTAKGNPSLDAKALDKLANVHGVDIVESILNYRKYEKLLGTYAIGIYGQRDAADKVHGSINQTEATTGRMSITKPALQTLPKRDKRIRKAFIPSDGYTMFFMDLDQIEYRLFAHYAKIESLIEQIKQGYDVHAATAVNVFGGDLATLAEEIATGNEEADAKRSKAKTLNFALIYGMGIDALAVALRCTSSQASAFKAKYFSAIPEAKVFIATVHNVIKARGFVRNMYGRRRRLDSNDSYKAPNSLIQGCAADYIKYKLVAMYKYIKHHNLKTRLINVVHDEVVLEVHTDDIVHIGAFRWILSDFETFRCPITAGVDIGRPSWGQKESYYVDFKEPDNKEYLQYNVYDGSVFEI